ncbi:MAG: L-serine ammonia-lyase, iron-sulfur-dependent, subunit alpha [Planctomycetota bacterium]
MKRISILNHVLGPVMRGPSSSHTAGAHRIGVLARALFGGPPRSVAVAFDAQGSFGQVYREQGADLAFAAGVMGWPIIDERFRSALDEAAACDLHVSFEVRDLPEADHPNTMLVELAGERRLSLRLVARSTGGGAIEITRLGPWPVRLTGTTYECCVEVANAGVARVLELLTQGVRVERTDRVPQGEVTLVTASRLEALADDAKEAIARSAGVRGAWFAEPVFFLQRGEALFSGAAEMVSLAENQGFSLGQAALYYEAALLGLSPARVLEEMGQRLDVMQAAVSAGLGTDPPGMQLLRPSAGKIMAAEAKRSLPLGGIHARIAARAMAVMHTNGGMGVVCAAPTAGSAGVLPAIAATLREEIGLSREGVALALLAGGVVGVIVGERATFAAEVAGCQVEIGAAGAMGAAMVVDASGGSASQAADAAAIAFQNTMGSVCDLVQGIVEVPCHTRNAVAASAAFLCADLVMGGYENPVPLDETIDAVYAVGRMLPSELRCTARGGLAVTPSALAMPRLR